MLDCAIEFGHEELVKELLIQFKPRFKLERALNTAIDHNRQSIVSLLLEHGAKINPDNVIITPLAQAITTESLSPDLKRQMITFLINECKANPNHPLCSRELTPLDYASLTKNLDIVILLLEKGAKFKSSADSLYLFLNQYNPKDFKVLYCLTLINRQVALEKLDKLDAIRLERLNEEMRDAISAQHLCTPSTLYKESPRSVIPESEGGPQQSVTVTPTSPTHR
jgi:ankyrin repeat protein